VTTSLGTRAHIVRTLKMARRLDKHIGVAMLAASVQFAEPVYAQTLPVGPLTNDGPPTPEQLSLLVPVTGALPTTATATVRYKSSTAATWSAGHPLFRVRPDFSESPAVGAVSDVFAWPIIDLMPGTTYDVEVTVSSGGSTQVLTGSFPTRQLPPPAGAPNKTIAAGSSGAAVQDAFDALNPGDVLQFENGTYNVDGLALRRSGTTIAPIYIRGASRSDVILSDPAGTIVRIDNSANVIIENMTFRGGGIDGGTSNFQHGVLSPDSATVQKVAIRNLTVNGVNQGIVFDNTVSEVLVYDNTLNGNNLWNASFVESNLTWNDDGIRVPGAGNAVFNNSLRGFGDTLSLGAHSDGSTTGEVRAVYFYRNDVRNSGDDFVEADHAVRNVGLYDNRSHNSMTFLSLDPLYGGPLLFARNIGINIGRTPFKWNSQNSGHFVYNNTIVMTVRMGDDLSGWYQPNNGPQRAYGYRNNIFIYRGNGTYLPWIESTGHDPIDWTHNSWFPDKGVQWGGVYPSIATAQASIPQTTPVFSGANRRFANDNVTTSDPFSPPVTLGGHYLQEVTDKFVPALSAGSSPKNSGVQIPNVTDGFTGAAPDRGAIVSGRAPVFYGDRSATAGRVPEPPTGLSVN
jgi:hypothetical protein